MDQWQVLIRDHHPGYLSWEDYLANQAKLAANRTHSGARPAREGHALCQGIIGCGSCGRPMSTRYHRDGTGAYECHARKDQQATPTCRSVSTHAVDEIVAERLLAALNPGRGRARLRRRRRGHRPPRPRRAGPPSWPWNAPATTPTGPSGPSTPPNRRTGWSCAPSKPAGRPAWPRWPRPRPRWQATRNAAPPLPARADLQALIGDLPRLWHADTTTARDRKRLLRTLIADITVLPETDRAKVRVGIRWHTGATDEITTDRPLPAGPAVAHPGPGRRADPRPRPHHQQRRPRHHAQRGRAPHRQGPPVRHRRRPMGAPRPQDPHPRATRPRRDQPSPTPPHRLGISADAVYYWIKAGHLPARRGPGNRLAITWTPEIETSLPRHASPAQATSTDRQSQPVTAGEAV